MEFEVKPEETVVVPKSFVVTLNDKEAYDLVTDILALEYQLDYKGGELRPGTKALKKFLGNRNMGS